MGIGRIMVQNVSGRIIANMTAETIGALLFMSSEIAEGTQQIDELDDGDPRCKELWREQVRKLTTYREY